MRGLGIIIALVLSACASAPTPATLAAGQAWRMPLAEAPDAKVIVGAITERNGRKVAHVSIIDLPAPPRLAEALARSQRFSPFPPDNAREGAPVSRIIISGVSDLRGEWTDISILLDASPAPADGAVSVPGYAFYVTDLAPHLSAPAPARLPSPLFDLHINLWTAGETEFAMLHDEALSRAAPEVAAIASLAARQQAAGWLQPIPPAAPAADETPSVDPELEAGCRRMISFVLEQDGTEILATRLMRSSQLGHIWRADIVPRGAPRDAQSVNRVLCWRGLDDGATLAFEWSTPPLSRAPS